MSYVLLGVGEALLGMKKPAEALALFEHALAIRQKAGMPAPMIKEATDAIADAKKTLTSLGRRRRRSCGR